MSNFGKRNTKASKLTPAVVLQMRQDYEAGATQGELCRRYDISVGQVGRIVRGESWRGLGPAAVNPLEVQLSAARVAAELQMRTNDPVLDENLELMRQIEREMPVGGRPVRVSLLDGGDAQAEGEGGLTALQQRMKDAGADVGEKGHE